MEDGRVKLMRSTAVIDGMNFALIAAWTNIKGMEGIDPVEKYRNTLWSMLKSITSNLPHDNWYVCWDSFGGKDFRKEIDENYKAGRNLSLPGIEFKDINDSQDLFDFFNIKSIRIPKAEADDVIHYVCKICKEKNPQSTITIISRDKDLLQTVQAGYASHQYDPVKKAYLEVPFYSIVDYKALVGDTSDAIPGVRGIGPKKALKILTGAVELTPDQVEVFEKYKKMIDFTLNPRFEENMAAVREELIKLED